ncbi:MAG: M56 family metallopeptidase [Gemmatimonadales bacterium]|jgi:beta-lactamase regulating signal transducer with metallopeptidase domain
MTMMHALLEALSAHSAAPAAGFAGEMLLRGAALLALATAATLLLRRAPASLRHHVWMLAMTGLLILPLLTGALPGWRVPLPEVVTAAWPATGPASIAASAERAAFDPTGPTMSKADGRADFETAGAHAAAVTGDAVRDSRVESVHRPGNAAGEAGLTWPALLLLAWGAGFFAFALRLVVDVGRAALLVRRARPVTDRQWNVLVSLLSLKAGLGRGVRVVSSPEVNVPMAWGILGRWLVLPEDFETWPVERRRVVVLHELAHLRRRDCLAQAIARLALAVHWPNPLAWFAARRITAEREQACDDAVLTAGVRGPSYAHHLVEIARGLSRPGQPARAAVAMARPSELENRVVAILDERRSRRVLGRRTSRLAFVGAAALLLPVAAIRPATASASADPADQGGPAPVAERSLERQTPVPALDRNVEAEAEATPAATDESEAAAPETAPRGSDLSTALAGLELATAAKGDTIEQRVYDALARALASDDPEVRAEVAQTLGSIESPRGVDLLVGVVADDESAMVREKAAWALGMIESDRAVAALTEAAGDPSDAVRAQVAWALGMIESVDGVDPLLGLLGDANAEVRSQAAWGLGMIESPEAVTGLSSAFASEAESDVRSQIVWALGMIEDREAVDTIVDALEDPDPDVRKQALWALGQVMG